MTESNSINTKAKKTNHAEWKVMGVLMLSFLFMEAFVRQFAGSLSLDLRNTLTTPETARRITQASDKKFTVLVLGNSLARCGVDLELINQDTILLQNKQKPQNIHAERFNPDASSIVQWNWGLKRYFTNTGSHPDVILLITGSSHLLDSPTSPETLGAYFVGSSDLVSAANSMENSENALRLLLGSTSHLLANKDRVLTRVGYSYIPGFEITWPALTATTGTKVNASEEPIGNCTKSLEHMIATTKKMGTQLYIISVPMPESYKLRSPVSQLLTETNTPYWDFSTMTDITPNNFPDNYHMDEVGSKIFTQAILTTLKQELLKQSLSSDTPDP